MRAEPEKLVKVKRIVANIEARDPAQASAFYACLLGLEVLMDQGWIKTFGSDEQTSVQISVASEGGSGTQVPDVSIEVDDLDEVLARINKAQIAIEYGPTSEPWGVRRFFVRDPFGTLINVMEHE